MMSHIKPQTKVVKSVKDLSLENITFSDPAFVSWNSSMLILSILSISVLKSKLVLFLFRNIKGKIEHWSCILCTSV